MWVSIPLPSARQADVLPSELTKLGAAPGNDPGQPDYEPGRAPRNTAVEEVGIEPTVPEDARVTAGCTTIGAFLPCWRDDIRIRT